MHIKNIALLKMICNLNVKELLIVAHKPQRMILWLKLIKTIIK